MIERKLIEQHLQNMEFVQFRLEDFLAFMRYIRKYLEAG